MTICERMFDELDKRNLTAYALCQALGVTTSTTTTWKQRGTDPPAKHLCRICEFLGCSLEYLLTGQDSTLETKKAPSHGLSKRGLELIGYFEQLGEYEQGVILGEARGLLLASGGAGEKAIG